MDKSNAFLDYLQTDRFFEKISESVFWWCTENLKLLHEKLDGSQTVSKIVEVEDVDLDFKQVWIDCKANSKIEFDIAIEVDVSVIGYCARNRDREQYSARIWVNVNCTGSLIKKLDDFNIVNVDEYDKTKPKKPLDGDLVPVMSASTYETYANEILEKYYYPSHPEAKTNPIAINVVELAERMNLMIRYHSISENQSIFGQIFFADTSIEIYNSKTKEYYQVDVKKNTMIVDEEAAYLRSFGSRNMTIAHECVHAYYHRNAFLFAQMQNEDLQYIQCQVNGTMRNASIKSTADWMEIHANGLAPYILMPKESFYNHARTLISKYTQSKILPHAMINVIDDLSKLYEVSKYAVRKRLIDLGFESAKGAYNWIDDHYVRPYVVKKNLLEKNETYTINYKDVYKKVLSNSKLFMQLMNNQFVFVENHLCLNDTKYVEHDIFGELILTDYARLNMDECCVKFTYKSMSGFNKNSEFGLMCYLCRDMSKELEFQIEVADMENQQLNKTETIRRYKITKANENSVIRDIEHMSFGEIIDYLLKYDKKSVKELEVDSGVSERMIYRYINNKVDKPNNRRVVAILRALNLPPSITNIAIKQAGINFRYNHDEDDALFTVLTAMRECSVKQCNDFLIGCGHNPLTNDE